MSVCGNGTMEFGRHACFTWEQWAIGAVETGFRGLDNNERGGEEAKSCVYMENSIRHGSGGDRLCHCELFEPLRVCLKGTINIS